MSSVYLLMFPAFRQWKPVKIHEILMPLNRSGPIQRIKGGCLPPLYPEGVTSQRHDFTFHSNHGTLW